MQLIILFGLFGLLFEGFGFALQLVNHIVESDEILLRFLKFLDCHLLAMLVFGNARDFVKQIATFFGTCIEDEINFTLLHDGVSCNAHPCVHKEFSNIT